MKTVGLVNAFNAFVEQNKPRRRPVSFYIPALFPHDTLIYALVDPITYNICYIGSTKNAEKRFRSHIRSARPFLNSEKILVLRARSSGLTTITAKLVGKYNKELWIASLLSQNLTPIMLVIEYVPSKLRYQYEQYWMNKFTDRAFSRLFNRVRAQKKRRRRNR